MAIHESSVNYQNLIRDLAEMYPFEVSEVVLVELVANSLDAKATRISIDCDTKKKVLVVTDNGKGMNATDFDEYHDFAAGLKIRGTGIGFAGVGAKVSFNIADKVITETRSDSFCGGSTWYLQSKRRLLWENIEPTHLHGTGTRVEVFFRQEASLYYSSTNDLVKLLRRHYLPLMDSRFLDLYERLGYYTSDLRFIVNGQTISPSKVRADLNLDKVREFFPQKLGKRIGCGIFGLAPLDYPLSPDVCGVMLCTHGKVIKADLFNQFPGGLGPRIFGLVEVPDFVNFLTTSKTDFVRRGKPGEFEKIYGPIREEFKTWLGELGIQTVEIADANEDAVKLERELKKLVDDVPELSKFFGFRTRKNILQQSDNGSIIASMQDGTEQTFPAGEGKGGKGPGPLDIGNETGQAAVNDPEVGTEKANPISRSARRGPKISFAERPDRIDLAWVEGNNVFINSAHPSYIKARSNVMARRIHSLYAIGDAIQRFLASEGDNKDLMFIDRMMAAWGKR